MARERYLVDEGEETIHNEKAEIKADTKKSKWENFWFYHKWHLLIAVIAVALVGSFVHEMVTKVNPDYQIGLLSQKTYPNEVITKLQSEIEKYASDLNGDGKVVVQINSYTIAQGKEADKMDPNMQMAGVTRFTADMQTGSCMLILNDMESLKMQQDTGKAFAYTDGSTPAEDAKDYDRMRIPWKDCKLLSNLKLDIDTNAYHMKSEDVQKDLSDLGLSLRVFEGTPLAQKQDKVEYFKASKALLDKLVNGK